MGSCQCGCFECDDYYRLGDESTGYVVNAFHIPDDAREFIANYVYDGVQPTLSFGQSIETNITRLSDFIYFDIQFLGECKIYANTDVLYGNEKGREDYLDQFIKRIAKHWEAQGLPLVLGLSVNEQDLVSSQGGDQMMIELVFQSWNSSSISEHCMRKPEKKHNIIGTIKLDAKGGKKYYSFSRLWGGISRKKPQMDWARGSSMISQVFGYLVLVCGMLAVIFQGLGMYYYTNQKERN